MPSNSWPPKDPLLSTFNLNATYSCPRVPTIDGPMIPELAGIHGYGNSCVGESTVPSSTFLSANGISMGALTMPLDLLDAIPQRDDGLEGLYSHLAVVLFL